MPWHYHSLYTHYSQAATKSYLFLFNVSHAGSSVPFPVLSHLDCWNRWLASRFFPPPIQVVDYHPVPVATQDLGMVSQGHRRELKLFCLLCFKSSKIRTRPATPAPLSLLIYVIASHPHLHRGPSSFTLSKAPGTKAELNKGPLLQQFSTLATH